MRIWHSLLKCFVRKDSQDHTDRYRSLLEAAMADMGRARSIPQLLNIVGEVVMASFRAKFGAVFLRDKHQPHWTLAFYRESSGKPFGEERLSEKNALISWLTQEKERLVLMDLKKQLEKLALEKDRRARHQENLPEEERERFEALTQVIKELERLNAVVCVPGFSDGKLKCLLLIGEKLFPQPYNLEDLNAFSILTASFGLAIENAEAYEELRNTKDQLLESTRLATIGKFSTDMAHEIKNPLQSILTFFQLLPEKKNAPDFMDRFAKVAEGEAQRIYQMVREMMSYTNLRPPEFQLLDMDQIVDSVLDLLENDLSKHGVEIQKGYSPNRMAAEADANQMKQVFLNLFMNALDAMASQDGKPKRLEIVIFPNVKELIVKIRDTGPGIPSHLIPQLFTGSVTTKQKGSGVGLSIAHQILQVHKATINVQSDVGQGTTFTITMPIHQSTQKPS